ncbi:NUDIX hydrolase [Marinoscillum sp. MHG1-6]|uniref:NUDIX hydrolase n=1 Tax=Marinoscillum sp. MHG1-6 TaxID=2959627 RepID=UPI0021573C35|nr:NUDIX hydrolase [Marinoscillum sp. MHG1-6]
MRLGIEVLDYLKRVQAMAKTGLSYTENPYDVERYEELRDYTNKMISLISGMQNEEVKAYFDHLDRYPTPKVDVRAFVVKEERLLMVCENTDGKWAIPGGWADIGVSPEENVIKEVKEETGFQVKVKKLLAVWDKRKHDHPPAAEYVYKLNFLCEITGGSLNPGHETLGADFFEFENLPELSLDRNTTKQILKLRELARSSETAFD